MTLQAAMLKQQIDGISGALRHATSCHDLYASSSRLDQHNYKLQSQRGGLRKQLSIDRKSLNTLLHNRIFYLHDFFSIFLNA